MKKRIILGVAIVAAIATMVSCEIESVGTNLFSGIFGESTIYISHNDQVDTMQMSYSLMDNIAVEEEGVTAVSSIDFSANIDLRQGQLDFPYLAFQFTDTTTGVYSLTPILNPQMLLNFNYETITDIICNPSGFSLLVVALSDTSWYISNSGTINVNDYASKPGDVMSGTFNNVGVYYLTQSAVDRFNDDYESGNMGNLSDYVTPATISGSFSSRRASVIQTIIANLTAEE